MSDGKAGKERSAMCLQIFTDKNMMKIIVEKSQYHRFALYYDYTQERVDFCKDLKESFGWKSFSFDSSAGLKRWVFSESLLVPVIKERFPETSIDSMVEEVVAHEQQWAVEAKKKETQLSEIKTKKDTNFTVKGLKKALYPYQKVGVEFLTVSGGRAIVADAPGLGKTASALAYIKHNNFSRSLVVAPASVKFAWKNEISKWLPDSFSAYVINGKPTPDTVNSLMSFLAFDSQIGGNRNKKSKDIHTGLNSPTELSQLGGETGSLKSSDVFLPTKGRKPIDKSFIGIINTQCPSDTGFSYGRRNTSFPINNSSHVGKINGPSGGGNGDSLSFPSSNSKSIHSSSKRMEGDFHAYGTIPKSDSTIQKRDGLLVEDSVPNKFVSFGIHKIIIINYDILSKWQPIFKTLNIECLIGDECQLIKSTGAIRTKAFRIISRNIPHIILLSGTPLLSRPSELFSLLNIVDPATWDNFYDFARRYCNAHQTRWGLDTSGVSNPEELHARIKGYFIRRNKDEVLKELPPKTFIDVPVKLDPDTAKRYALAASDLAIFLRQYSGKQPAQIAKTLSAEKLTKKNVLRLINALGKIDIAIELIESVIDAGEKVLVFSSFIEPLDKLKEHFKDKAVMITGATDVKDREEVVRVFQNDPNVPVFLGGIRSAGVGITLTAASNVIFLDFPWNPADYQQAQDRVHRPGQVAKAVNIYQLFAMGTVDEDLREMLNEKQQIFDQVIDGKLAEKSTSDVMEAIERRILNEY